MLDVSQIPSSITAHAPGYIDRENEIVVGLQTEAPLKRAIMPARAARPSTDPSCARSPGPRAYMWRCQYCHNPDTRTIAWSDNTILRGPKELWLEV